LPCRWYIVVPHLLQKGEIGNKFIVVSLCFTVHIGLFHEMSEAGGRINDSPVITVAKEVENWAFQAFQSVW
jgi:hypothetical protein